jgi:transcription elongation factor S-II
LESAGLASKNRRKLGKKNKPAGNPCPVERRRRRPWNELHMSDTKVKNELLTLSSALGKTDDINRITDILKTLATLELSYPLLKETKIGQVVSKYRKHEAEGVAEAAKQLLKSWKKLAPSTPRSTKETEKWGEEEEEGGAKPKPNAPPRKPPPADGMRNIAYKRLLGVFNIDGLFEETETEQKAIELEDEMHQKFQGDKKGYKEKYMQLILNLKKNDNLRANVMNDSTPAASMMTMSSQDMQTEEMKEHIEKGLDYIRNEMRLNWSEVNEDKINAQCNIKDQSGIFRCGKCKGYNTSNYQKQTRSADEPMTV